MPEKLRSYNGKKKYFYNKECIDMKNKSKYMISLLAFAGICCDDHTSVIHIIHHTRVSQNILI